MTRTTRQRRGLLRTVALVGVIGIAAAACGDDGDDAGGGSDADAATEGAEGTDDALAHYQEEGLVIGIANERPYGYEENGEATGEAPELGREIFAELGIDDVEYTVADFGALINGLNAGRMDAIAAGMFITPGRAEQVLFADPDYCATTSLAVPEDNPDGLTDFQSVLDSDVTLGVVTGTAELTYAQEIGIPDSRLEEFPGIPDVFDGLAAGRVDAVALTRATVETQTAELDGFEATEGFVPVIDGEEQLGCGAFAFRHEDQALRDAFTEVLNEMQDNGEVLPIVEPFGFIETEIETAEDVTAADLAGGAYDDLELAGGSPTRPLPRDRTSA